MVKDQNVDTVKLSKYLEDVNLIIAHNSEFDRAFFETTFPTLKPYAWACSMRDVDWKNEGIGSLKLDYIAYQYNFFYTGHRSISDCLASIHILSKNLPVSKTLVLKSIIDKANKLRFKLWATNAPYHAKELLKARGYRWNMENGLHRSVLLSRATPMSISAFLNRVVTYDRDRYYTSRVEESTETTSGNADLTGPTV